MNASVDRRIAAVDRAARRDAVNLPDDSEPRVEVGQATWRQGRAPGGKLEEGLSLLCVHCGEDVDETLESRAVAGVAQLGLRVVHYVLSRPTGALVAAQKQAELSRAEARQSRHREYTIESLTQCLHLTPDSALQAKLGHQIDVLLYIVKRNL